MAVNYETFTAELVEAFHLEQVPEEKREALLAKVGEVLLKRIFLETMEKIGDAGVVEYEGLLLREAKEEEVEAFFESKIPGYTVFVQNVVNDFKHEIMNDRSE